MSSRLSVTSRSASRYLKAQLEGANTVPTQLGSAVRAGEGEGQEDAGWQQGTRRARAHGGQLQRPGARAAPGGRTVERARQVRRVQRAVEERGVWAAAQQVEQAGRLGGGLFARQAQRDALHRLLPL